MDFVLKCPIDFFCTSIAESSFVSDDFQDWMCKTPSIVTAGLKPVSRPFIKHFFLEKRESARVVPNIKEAAD